MKKDFLFAVSAVRANEDSLLSGTDIEQLVSAPDYKSAVALLNGKGREIPEDGDYSAALERETEKAWELITENAPDAEALGTLAVKNDFQNLKAALKAEKEGLPARDYFVSPCLIDKELLYDAVSERHFELLPDYMSEAAQKAYKAITETGSGQLCDIILDSCALRAIYDFAVKSKDEILIEYAESVCLAADIKTAYRCARSGKSRTFINEALSHVGRMSGNGLCEAAEKGEDELFEFLRESGFSEYADILKESPSGFEKLCDDRAVEIMKKAKMTVFGTSPLAAYYVARETEVKTLRIILSGKLGGVPNEIIRERLREAYV